MKKLFYIQDTPANKISYYLLLLFLVSLPFDRFYSELLLAGFSAHTLLHIKHVPWCSLKQGMVWISASVFLLSAAGLTYTDFPKEGLRECTRQSAFFIFPLMLGITRLDLLKYKDHLLLAFSFACTIVVLYLYINAFQIILYNHMPVISLFSERFINHHFSEPLGIHATYLSMYVFTGLLFILNQYMLNKQAGIQLLYMGCTAVLGAGLIQLGSKSVLNSAFICINVIVPFFIADHKARKLYHKISIFCSAAVIILILAVPVLRNRYVTGFKEDLVPHNNQQVRQDPRLSRWLVAMELINNKPIAGYGTGSEIPLLEKAYYKKQLYFSYYYSLNTHNQYLGIALSTGYLGLLVFAGALFASIYTAIKRRDVNFTCFMVLIAVVCFSENILLVNKGIFFYGFLSPLFMLSFNKKLIYVYGDLKK